MLPVYLCDDEPTWLKRLEKSITDFQIKSDLELYIAFQSTSPKELIQYLSENTPMNGIYFLDIDFKTSLTGLELAKQIRLMDPLAFIIFVTTHEEMAMETFRLKLAALDYIIKDTSNLEIQIQQCLEHIETQFLQEKQIPSSTICLRINGSYQVFSTEDIYYIESIKGTHKISLHLHSEIHHIPVSLSTMQEKTNDVFFQCHKTCIVNPQHIVKLDTKERLILLDNGDSCPCSARTLRQLSHILYPAPTSSHT